MHRKRFALMILAAVSCTRFAFAQSPTPSASNAFDGQWFVILACEDVKEKGRVAKGYTFRFPAEVKAGKLNGQVGVSDRPSQDGWSCATQRHRRTYSNWLHRQSRLHGRSRFHWYAIFVPIARQVHS
jgi:hypothetical protein